MITVKLPDGSTAQFPEGTPPEEIKRVLERDFPKAPAEAPLDMPAEVPTGMQIEGPSQPILPGKFREMYTLPSPEDQALLDATLPKSSNTSPLTPTTVLEDEEAMGNIRKYMTRFQGYSADTPDEELVDSFLAHQRKFAAGQSVVTLGELYSLQKADEEGLAIAANAYDTFDRFSGVFSEDYTWGEMFDGLGSYVRAAIIDPTNLVGLGVGRLITGSSTKAGTVVLKSIAQEAAEKAMKKTLVKKLGAKGARGVLQKQAAGEALKMPAQKAAVGAATQAAKLAEREVLRKAATTATVSTALKKQALKETAIATGVDSALAVGVDLAYQEGMILTGRQEEYDPVRSGLIALGGLVGGGITYGFARRSKALAKESTGILKAFQATDPIESAPVKAAEKLSQGDGFMKIMEENFTEFSNRVASGKKLTEEGELIRGVNEQEFFRAFLLGNDKMGTKGLAHAMADLGVTLPARPRYEGDNVVSFMADMLERLPKAQKDAFEKLFREKVGAHLPNYNNATMKDIADLMSYQTSVSGQQLQIFSEVKSILKIAGEDTVDFLDTTVDEILAVLNPAAGTNDKLFKRGAEAIKDRPRTISYFQSQLIPIITAHPGTTVLNIKGSVFRGVADTAADFVEGALYTGLGLRGFVTGNMSDWKKGVGIIKASVKRPVQLLDSRATIDEIDDYLAMRPHVEEALFRFLSGAIDNTDLKKAFNMDKAGNLTQRVAEGVDSYREFAQKLYLSKTQDKVFKNLNMMYYLEKNIQAEFGMSYKQFMKQPNAVELMQSERYLAREFKALEDTLSSVFSLKYSSKETLSENPIHFVATTIENLSKVPIIGAAMPFGQFFNNTVDFMANYSGAKFAYRLAGFGEGRSKEALVESLAKGAVGLAFISSMSTKEMGYIEEGLGAFEARDQDGQIVSKQYDFPESFFKGIARAVAHLRMGQEIPTDLQATLFTTFGPEAFVRSLGQGMGKAQDYFGEVRNQEDILGVAKSITEAIFALGGSSWVSGFTRPIDPINQMAGFFKEEGATYLDRRQGFRALNESARYIDQFPGVSEGLMALGAVERSTPARETPVGEVGKLFGYRIVPEQSYTQRMMNGIERPDWQSGFAGKNSTGSPELDNRLNAFIFQHIEPRAARLLLGTRWKEMSIAEKTKAVDKMWAEARKAARKSLLGSSDVEDLKVYMMDKVISAAGSQKNVERAMESLGLSGDLSDYDAQQMRAILRELERIEQSDEMAPYKR